MTKKKLRPFWILGSIWIVTVQIFKNVFLWDTLWILQTNGVCQNCFYFRNSFQGSIYWNLYCWLITVKVIRATFRNMRCFTLFCFHQKLLNPLNDEYLMNKRFGAQSFHVRMSSSLVCLWWRYPCLISSYEVDLIRQGLFPLLNCFLYWGYWIH